MSKLNWKVHDGFDGSFPYHPVASLFAGDTRILSMYEGVDFYATNSVEVIHLPWWQVSFKDADDIVKRQENYSGLSKKEKEKLRLEAACDIIEGRVKKIIVSRYIEKMNL